jgi:hypothetical protein
MRRLWAGGLVFAVGWFTGGASGQDVVWRPARRPTTPAAMSLGQPAPVRDADHAIEQATFQTVAPADGGPVLHVQNLDVPTARPRDDGPPAMLPETLETAFATEAPLPSSPAAPSAVPAAPPASILTFDRPGTLPCAGCDLNGAYAVSAVDGNRFFFSTEYLGWTIREQRLPILITTGPVASQGRIGQPGTVPLFGGDDLPEELRSGVRLSAGYWFDPCQLWAVEGNIFGLAPRHTRFAATSDEFPLLARPFFNLNQNLQDSQVTTQPGFEAGGITVTTSSKLWGTELNLRRNLIADCSFRFDVFAGFRYLDLEEKLDVAESIIALPGFTGFAGDRIFVDDHFGTRNQFFGGQIGAITELRWGRWTFDVRGKLALGNNHQTVDIHGQQQVTDPAGTTSSFNGGLLAVRSNSGHFTRDHFAVVPEASLNLGYQFTDHLRGFIGYNFLYWSNVIRPGDQIDQNIDITQIPNFRPGVAPVALNRPAAPFKETSFWAQGANVGLEIRY